MEVRDIVNYTARSLVVKYDVAEQRLLIYPDYSEAHDEIILTVHSTDTVSLPKEP